MSEKPKSVLDVLARLQELETRLQTVESLGELVIDSGELSFDQDPLLSSGEDKERSHRIKIKYNKNFVQVLAVIPSLERIDTDGHFSSRFDLRAENISATGFDLIVGTWYQTKIWDIRVKWYAIGLQ